MCESAHRGSFLWQICKSFKPHLNSWDGEYVVFDELTGDTIRLAQLEGHILEKLLISSLSVDDLVCSIQPVANDSPEEIRQALLRILEEMKNASLVAIQKT